MQSLPDKVYFVKKRDFIIDHVIPISERYTD